MHIVDAITEIENYTRNVKLSDFLANSMMRFASIKQIEIIGEAAYYVTSEIKARFPGVEWDKIAGIRHILVHEYFGIDEHIAWQVIITDIPVLKEQIVRILSEFE
jgi:uncharacterized protein with HEPN domain